MIQADTLVPLLQVVWSFVLIFCVCEFGETITSQFRMFNVELCHCNWYLFPIEVQRMLVIFMADVQQPTFIQGYGNTVCIREVFKKVK